MVHKNPSVRVGCVWEDALVWGGRRRCRGGALLFDSSRSGENSLCLHVKEQNCTQESPSSELQ